MSAKRGFTKEQVEAAIATHGTVRKAAKALGCSDVTVYHHLGRLSGSGNGANGATAAMRPDKTAPAVLASTLQRALAFHEKRIAEINKLLADLTHHQEQAARIRQIQQMLNPPIAEVLSPTTIEKPASA